MNEKSTVNPCAKTRSEDSCVIRHSSANPADCGAIQILLIDGDVVAQRTVRRFLEEDNMRVMVASDRAEIDRVLSTIEPHLIILELPHGLDVLRSIRSRSDIPVIVAAGRGADDSDGVVGLELGADDYVVKPFAPRELRSRIRAVLRRCKNWFETGERGRKKRSYYFGDYRLNISTRTLVIRNLEQIALTRMEYALLTAFLDAPQRPLSRQYLALATHIHDEIFDRSVDVAVLRLRRKLRVDHELPSVIRNERGVGYKLCLSVKTNLN
jgi:DNA-binding response OmpR family regulator